MPGRIIRIAKLVILIYFVLLGVLYSRAVPIFEASDEAEHFIYIHTILNDRHLPVIQSKEDMAQQRDPVLRWNNQSHHAPLYYLLSAALISWSERADIADYLRPNELIFLRNTFDHNANKWFHNYGDPTSDTHKAVYFLRFVNLMIGVGTLLVVYRGGMVLFGAPQPALFLMLLTASIPTFVAVHSGVTNDALLIFLYTSGLVWLIGVWRVGKFRRRDSIFISVIVGATALAKLTGLTLLGLVWLVLAYGAFRGRWRWSGAIRVMVIIAIATGLCAGWWYLRNWHLYGDPFALDATASIWGREAPLDWSTFGSDTMRVSRSFWMMVGYLHSPVFAPTWFYWWTGFAAILAILGWVRSSRDDIDTILVAAGAVVVATVVIGTRTVDISYGRLLFPSIFAFVALLVKGWYAVPGRLHVVMAIPFLLLSVAAPVKIIPDAYPRLEAVSETTGTTTNFKADGGSLEIVAVDVLADQVSPDGQMQVALYIRGRHPLNPALLISAIDPIGVHRLDHLEVYPGMAATDSLEPDQLYRLVVQMTIQHTEPHPPRIVFVNFEWIDTGTNETVTFESGQERLEMHGPVLNDPAYQVAELDMSTKATFTGGAEKIDLSSISVPALAKSGDVIDLSFNWNPRVIENDWTLTIQMYDESGNFITQWDGMPYWYPTSAWLEDVPFSDKRTITVPEDLDQGRFQFRIGWYKVSDTNFERMSVNGDSVDNLLVLPTWIDISG